jgi:hypothetical protein
MRPGSARTALTATWGTRNSVGDRYGHRLRGQLTEDARRLEDYLHGEAAEEFSGDYDKRMDEATVESALAAQRWPRR